MKRRIIFIFRHWPKLFNNVWHIETIRNNKIITMIPKDMWPLSLPPPPLPSLQIYLALKSTTTKETFYLKQFKLIFYARSFYLDKLIYSNFASLPPPVAWPIVVGFLKCAPFDFQRHCRILQ